MTRFVAVLLGALFPPVGVFMVTGIGTTFWINLLLTLLAYLPGQLHGLWVVAHTSEDGSHDPDGFDTFFALLVAFILPPLGVLLKCGVGSGLVINILLTALFWLPGSIHAVWLLTAEE